MPVPLVRLMYVVEYVEYLQVSVVIVTINDQTTCTNSVIFNLPAVAPIHPERRSGRPRENLCNQHFLHFQSRSIFHLRRMILS